MNHDLELYSIAAEEKLIEREGTVEIRTSIRDVKELRSLVNDLNKFSRLHWYYNKVYSGFSLFAEKSTKVI